MNTQPPTLAPMVVPLSSPSDDSGGEPRAGIAGLANLGPASARMLSKAGIVDLAQLRELGAVEAFRRVRASGAEPSLNLLWALEGALTGRRWQDVAHAERTSLLLEIDALDALEKRKRTCMIQS